MDAHLGVQLVPLEGIVIALVCILDLTKLRNDGRRQCAGAVYFAEIMN